MQLAAIAPQPVIQPPAQSPQPAAAPPVVADQPTVPIDDTAPAPAPAPRAEGSDAGIGARILGRVAEKQMRSLQSQQVIAMISQQLAERLSLIGAHTWAVLRGTADTDPRQ